MDLSDKIKYYISKHPSDDKKVSFSINNNIITSWESNSIEQPTEQQLNNLEEEFKEDNRKKCLLNVSTTEKLFKIIIKKLQENSNLSKEDFINSCSCNCPNTNELLNDYLS